MSDQSDIDKLLATVERIGVVGSPSTTGDLSLEILGAAVGRKLVGELALLPFPQDGVPHYALGQITEVKLRNLWHEDATMRSLIRQRGRVDAVTERQDTHQGEMTVSAVFARGSKSYEPSILGTVPSTGTNIHLVNDALLDELLAPYKSQLFYLGTVYGSKPRLPLWFKHFNRGSDGAGEAYHLGVFGKTGSGKSVLAKMILCAYARYPEMAILVIDPQGEFSKDLKPGVGTGEFVLPVADILGTLGKPKHVLTVQKLVLDRWDLFQEILAESRFFRELQIMTADKVGTASEQLRHAMEKARLKLTQLHTRQAFDEAWKLLKTDKLRNKIYAKEGAAAERFADAVNEADADDLYASVWLPVANLFKEDHEGGRRTVEDALRWLLDPEKNVRPVLVVDVSREKAGGLFWNEKIQGLVIKRLLDGVNMVAERMFKENRYANALVIIDEAHRLAPRFVADGDDTAKGVRSTLIDAVRTTRKYGLGWMFISQTLSSLHSEILQQLRISFFGFGLALGTEFQALSDLVGGKSRALDLYRLFRDPHSSFDIASRQYSFMTIGPVSPLSFAGTPLFLNVFNNVDEFVSQNGLLAGSQENLPLSG
jgi:Predicted ATPase